MLVPVALLLMSVDSRAQKTSVSDQVKPDQQSELQLLGALLEEVRRLRLALTENGLLQHRSNLLLARVREQESVVQEISSQLRTLNEEVRLLSDSGRYDEQIDEIKDLEAQMNETLEPADHLDLSHEVGRMKRRLERQKKNDAEELERKRELKPGMEQQLQVAQQTLNDLNQQLEVLQREMDQRLAAALESRPRAETANRNH
jgi:uncharacterized phage infection (PIP) family protein YhgE